MCLYQTVQKHYCQHDFRLKKYCSIQPQAVDKMTHELEEGEPVDACYLDFTEVINFSPYQAT